MESDLSTGGGATPPEPAALAVSGLRTTGALPRIVIGGGGAGGLELAVQPGTRLGRGERPHADVVLVDARLTHVWKPVLHELAAGARPRVKLH